MFRKRDFLCVWILHIVILIIFYFQVHKITSAKLFVVRYSHLTAMMLVMQVFLSVTQCHCAYGSEITNRHSTYIFKCPAIQEELTLCSSATFDITQPKTLCHITEDLNPHLGSVYRMWLRHDSSASLSLPKQCLFQERWCCPTYLWCHRP